MLNAMNFSLSHVSLLLLLLLLVSGAREELLRRRRQRVHSPAAASISMLDHAVASARRHRVHSSRDRRGVHRGAEHAGLHEA